MSPQCSNIFIQLSKVYGKDQPPNLFPKSQTWTNQSTCPKHINHSSLTNIHTVHLRYIGIFMLSKSGGTLHKSYKQSACLISICETSILSLLSWKASKQKAFPQELNWPSLLSSLQIRCHREIDLLCFSLFFLSFQKLYGTSLVSNIIVCFVFSAFLTSLPMKAKILDWRWLLENLWSSHEVAFHKSNACISFKLVAKPSWPFLHLP